jgi:hypothetical protein
MVRTNSAITANQSSEPADPLYDDFYSDFDKRFDGKNVRIATTDEVAPFAPRVYVEGLKFESSLYCAPVEYYLLRDLKNLNHGFKCDKLGLMPSIEKLYPTFEIPMACSYATDDVTVIRPGHPVFTAAFTEEKLLINLPLLLRFVIKYGISNRARDGVVSSGKEYGSRVDFGCAGSSNEEIAPGVSRPGVLCGIDLFNELGEDERHQVKQSIANIYDCMTLAANGIQEMIGGSPT